MPYYFWSAKNIKLDYILHLIFDKTMVMVALLFKWMMLIIRVCIMGIANKHKINTKSSTELELIGADDAMPQMLLTCYFYQTPIF